jgi:cell division protein ZapA (FtsZ GTPase activity inhibitor)
MDSKAKTQKAMAYPARMLVRLEGEVKHLARLVALLIDQLIADRQHSGETKLDNLVKVLPIVTFHCLVSKCTADGEQALKTSKNRARAVGIEQLNGEIHETRPSVGKVGLQNSLQHGNELMAHERF